MRLVVGVIGHVDHGKTALVRALTGIETDRLAEEKRRGISIALGFAHLAVPGGVIDLIDMPGHERFVRTMVSGATGMAAALLVVAANEGIRPQTQEHLDIAALLGIRRVVVAVSKADLPADAGASAGVVAETAGALVRRLGMEVVASVLTSAMTGEGMAALRDGLAVAAGGAAAADDGFFYLPVDRAFTLAGHGTVVTGTLRRGRLAVSDEAVVAPDGRAVRLRGLQVNGARVTVAEPGQRVAANLRHVEPGELPRGTALSARGVLQASQWLSVSLTAVEGGAALPDGMRLRLMVATAELDARLRLLDRDVLLPGERCVAQLHCAEMVALPARERFILRRPSPAETVAGGAVIDPVATRLRRGADVAALTAMAGAEPDEVLRLAVERAGAGGIALERAVQLAGISPARATAVFATDAAVVVLGGIAVQRASFESVVKRLPAVLGRFAEPVGREALMPFLPGAGEAVIAAALDVLVRRNLVRSVGGAVQLRRPEREGEEATEAARLAETLRQGGLSPPDPAALAPTPAAHRMLNRLIREGVAVRTVDVVQKRDIVFHRDAVEAAKARLRPHMSQPPGLLLGEAGAVLGISRKFCVPLLEHLDAIRFTRRVADRRMIAATEEAPAR